jgi:alpha-D-xyloside xylohydrolase
LDDILRAARLGYCVIGSDVAGYHGRSNPDDMGPATAALVAGWGDRTGASGMVEGGRAKPDAIAPNIYIRWAQFSAFCGLFLNGGHGERRLWLRTPAELEIIRRFSWLHTELVPYVYSHVVECHRGGRPLMRPCDDGEFHYRFGEDFLVAPIHADSPRREVSLPEGRWRYFFRPTEASLAGPVRLTREFPLDEYPVYLREGALVPLNVTRAYSGLGDRESSGWRTWLVNPGADGRFTLWHPETHPEPEATTVSMTAGDPLRVTFSGRREPHLLRVITGNRPRSVVRDGRELAEGADWSFEQERGVLVVRTRDYERGEYRISWR